mmetsp:Transcript_3839/g.9007  ORF Transcript_3839/g.9007 Transcript_3839/m.9007 type:complete len:312 (+) Transcript_3839:1278-2213(+)
MPAAPSLVSVVEDVQEIQEMKKTTVEVVEDGPAEASSAAAPCMALVPFSKARKPKVQMMIAALKTKYLQGMENKSPEECHAALLKKREELQAALEAQREASQAESSLVAAAREEYKAAGQGVETAIQNELEKARIYRAIRDERKNQDKEAEERQNNLVQAQMKLAMLEVVKANQDSMKQLREQREAALRAAKEAKENYLAEKKAFAQALNSSSTGKAAAGKGSRRGQKRGGGGNGGQTAEAEAEAEAEAQVEGSAAEVVAEDAAAAAATNVAAASGAGEEEPLSKKARTPEVDTEADTEAPPAATTTTTTA